jgi:hypothetical protein
MQLGSICILEEPCLVSQQRLHSVYMLPKSLFWLLREKVLIRSGTPQEQKYAKRIAPVICYPSARPADVSQPDCHAFLAHSTGYQIQPCATMRMRTSTTTLCMTAGAAAASSAAGDAAAGECGGHGGAAYLPGSAGGPCHCHHPVCDRRSVLWCAPLQEAFAIIASSRDVSPVTVAVAVTVAAAVTVTGC